ncbi:M28 family metallopeptidase [Nonomuraea gerenzanensis]|uniref:Leucine aminopeptidase-related protein n=1 Tax=Nonomuraea gerenzanensis TaxID=93944 RepID=A0A1M4DZ38_9ACTN|nr:M28 family metallopeptidase [Nonomuraea gerenzanensis]UBU14143.1 M28 family metallopeptidase [Nonomuraea gerenzanensis]SBO91832.1 Leucine aminopeptidase-related protein [Nonomuraea gerenzanensis]
MALSPLIRRSALPFLAAVLLAGVLTPAAEAGAPRDREIEKMVRQVDARNLGRIIAKLASFGTRHTLSSQDDPVRGIGAARDWIYDEFTRIAATSGGRMTVQKQSFVQPVSPRIPAPTMITNVVATLRGTQDAAAGRTYVVSGHYDSRCSDVMNATCDAPGANDDASGVAVAIEAARVMATRTFDATVVFMAVAGEEQGLYGSAYYAQQAKQSNTDIQGMFTNDIVGSADGENGREPGAVRVFSEGVPTSETPAQAAVRQSIGGENDGVSRQLARFVHETAEQYVPWFDARLYYRRDRYLRGGDQIPFLQQGYAAVRFTEVHENYLHQHQDVRVEDGVQYGDLLRFVEPDYVARVAQVNLAALAALARAPRSPGRAAIVTSRLTNDTDLRWEAGPEPDVAGYEVVWRATTEPLWTHSRFVGNVTSYRVEGLSKDNFQFGVRAVDEQGHRSPVSHPTPAS